MSLSSMIRIWSMKWFLLITWFHSSWVNVSVESLSWNNWLMLMSNWSLLLLSSELSESSNSFSYSVKTEARWVTHRWENFFRFRCNCSDCNLINWQWIETVIDSISWTRIETISWFNFWKTMLFWKSWVIASSRLCFFRTVWFWCRWCLSELFLSLKKSFD